MNPNRITAKLLWECANAAYCEISKWTPTAWQARDAGSKRLYRLAARNLRKRLKKT